MPRYIVKLGGKYLEWSTIIDAPVTYSMTLEEFTEYYRTKYGESSMNHFRDRMQRVESIGTSSLIDNSIDELIIGNRAGKDESELTMEELIKEYC